VAREAATFGPENGLGDGVVASDLPNPPTLGMGHHVVPLPLAPYAPLPPPFPFVDLQRGLSAAPRKNGISTIELMRAALG